jgi:hypothetical protein
MGVHSEFFEFDVMNIMGRVDEAAGRPFEA